MELGPLLRAGQLKTWNHSKVKAPALRDALARHLDVQYTRLSLTNAAVWSSDRASKLHRLLEHENCILRAASQMMDLVLDFPDQNTKIT